MSTAQIEVSPSATRGATRVESWVDEINATVSSCELNAMITNPMQLRMENVRMLDVLTLVPYVSARFHIHRVRSVRIKRSGVSVSQGPTVGKSGAPALIASYTAETCAPRIEAIEAEKITLT